MFIYCERAEDIIAHFIGQFELRLDEERMRLDYAEFSYRARAHEMAEPPPTLPADAAQLHRVKYYEPGVEHAPQFWHPSGEAPFGYPPLTRPEADAPRLEAERELPADRFDIHPSADFDWGQQIGVSETPVFIPAPGQVIFVVNQQISLQDNDVVNLGGGPDPVLDPMLEVRLADLVLDAHSVAPGLTDTPMPTSIEALPQFVADMSQEIGTLAEDDEHVVASGETLDGTWVNGAAADAAPNLKDALPAKFKPEEPAEEPPEAASAHETSDGPEPALTLEAGGNLLNNSAVLTNAGLTGGVVAVNGDVHRIDAIVQVNALSDNDNGLGPGGTSKAYNVATFATTLPEPPEGAAIDTTITPQGWQISVVEGDVVFLKWTSQVTFAYDNDLHVLTATGADSTITTGGNIDQNIVTFSDLGNYYDVILVEGDFYDVNMISQVNVLLDDDTGWGTDAASSSGNLLYNQATIVNVGSQNWLEGMPDHYRDAMDGLDHGRFSMPEGFGGDTTYAGHEGLRVLYVKGDVYDLNYIKQMNVLGDADQVSLAEAAMLDPDATSDWDISTGSNALVNTAAILDVDVMGDTAYVGGEEYSDAILIQADILNAGPEDNDPDELVAEVVAFLDSDDCGPPTDDDIGAPLADSGAPLDAMQSMLA
ncbi:hypothetical protein [Devosia geojensis]|uniref:hypothetical protein n=1 Tax=Devosia geojensis TaxID=443610 RepID=UPI000698FC01|nr:hypothetical protein [Devosia geojensis]